MTLCAINITILTKMLLVLNKCKSGYHILAILLQITQTKIPSQAEKCYLRLKNK